jgi:hypothetical protein
VTTMHTLADRIMLSRHPSPGLRYARRVEQTEKAVARNRVLSLFSPKRWPGNLNILTMPALDWTFERALLARRERSYPHKIRRTYLTCVESSPAIWTAALRNIPGGDTSLTLALPRPIFAREVARTRIVGRFFQCTVEDLAAQQTDREYDAAWIDLTGPLTDRRLAALASLWDRTNCYLIVTSLRARWAGQFRVDLAAHGGDLGELLTERLSGSFAVSQYTYADRSPMHQIVLARYLRRTDDSLTATGHRP